MSGKYGKMQNIYKDMNVRNRKQSNEIKSSNVLTDRELLKKRRERFSKNASRSDDLDYGLISRGEDLRLKDDPEARRILFETSIKEVKKYHNMNKPIISQRDQILLLFRKLREATVACSSSYVNGVDIGFAKNVLFESIRFSISVGHHQSYVPALNQAFEALDELQWTWEEKRYIIHCLVLHLMHFENKYEKAFQLLLDFEDINTLKNNKLQDMGSLNESELIYLTISLYVTEDYYLWLRIYHHLEESKERNIFFQSYWYLLRDTGFDKVIDKVLKQIGVSFFVLKKQVVEETTGVVWKQLSEKYKMEWKLKEDTDILNIRTRKKITDSVNI